MSERVRNAAFASKIMSAEDAAAQIRPGDRVGMSGFTGAGYPKVVPGALAKRIKAAHDAGQEFTIDLFTGASTAPELDGDLAAVDGIGFRTPYQSDPIMRAKINEGTIDYSDIHLSHLAQRVWEGVFDTLDVAVVEVTEVLPDGQVVPASSVGNNKSWLDLADKVILEVNAWQSQELLGMHDIYYGTALPPNRRPVMINRPQDRIGQTTYNVDPAKVIAVVETDAPDRNSEFKAPDEASIAIANHLLDFLVHQVERGRLPKSLLPLQSGVGNVANAVLIGLVDSPFEHLTSYTEVIQDGMVDLIESGKLDFASATAFSLSPKMAEEMNRRAAYFREKIMLRPQEISNHPEVIRRLGLVACNGMIEADIYGNVNSTHVSGTRVMNGIGGSGDFARNAFVSAFVTPSTAKNGAISCIVPFASHIDHTEHDTAMIITEQGLADIRGLSPRKRAAVIIDKCAHPDYKEPLREYVKHAEAINAGRMHTPHDLAQAFSWHLRLAETGTMQPS
ncbi:acetyl-CoA hydrolase/transferase family protein [Granulicoccus phenolivorans]|uniref:acetyl-CoA hydrolase/transferase family protein n=1 Tax=Granulicoccus phenolivorans TaxID=266854 RepID=UPI00041A103A|nr:acetyl-CoA hydrolase/transferase family protein [Granulicoccus phenolivorans]